MMKKTKMLSLLTAAAIVASTAGTYAVWDTVTAESRENTVTLRNPVTVSDTTEDQSIQANAASLNPGSITASGKVKFRVQNTDSLAKSLNLQETITAGSQGALAETTDYSIVFSGTDVSGKQDSTVTDGEEEYGYTITFTQTGLEKLQANSNQCSVKVTATLQ